MFREKNQDFHNWYIYILLTVLKMFSGRQGLFATHAMDRINHFQVQSTSFYQPFSLLG